MEMSLSSSYVAANSTTSRPLFFSNQTHFNTKTTSLVNVKRRKHKPSCVNSSFSDVSRGRQTLTCNWDFSGLSHVHGVDVPSASFLPRFEELDTTTMLLQQRIVFLGTQVDDMSADFVISQLLFLDAEDSKREIKLFINSPGGSVTAGMGIYDAMKMCKADVSTVCLGLAASMGAFLLAAGTKGKRFCMPNGRVMIHQPHGGAGGKSTDMTIRIREMQYQKIKLNKILSRITGKPVEQIDVDTDRDNFLNAWEAKEYGLVDEVIDDGKPGLVAPLVDAVPPPKTKVWSFWKVEGSKKALKNLPSEHRIVQNGNVGGQGRNGEKGSGSKRDTSPV